MACHHWISVAANADAERPYKIIAYMVVNFLLNKLIFYFLIVLGVGDGM